MKPSQVKASISILCTAGRVSMIWGSPGIGKSDVVKAVAKEKGVPLLDVRALLYDPLDIRGIPYRNEKNQTAYATPDIWPTDGEGILFIDEITSAPAATQASFYQLTLDRKIGTYELPPKWNIVLAGNRQSDKGVFDRMPKPLSERLTHIEFEPDLDDWVEWAYNNSVRPEIIGFLKYRPEMLNKFDSKTLVSPNPRSWKFVSDILKAGEGSETTPELISGTIGEGAAVELSGYLDTMGSLPDLDDIITNPTGAKVPTTPGAIYAVTSALAYKAPDYSILDYITRLPKEFQVVFMKDYMRIHPEVPRDNKFKDWISKNASILL